MKKILHYGFLITILLSIVLGCTTPYSYQTNGFEDALVIEATMTDQYKNHQIKLSRTYKLDGKKPTFESKAVVYVTDDLGNKYDFQEKNESYISVNQFQATPGRAYQLHILTKNGRTYVSNEEKLPQQTQIEKVEAKTLTKKGELGVEITVNSNDPTNKSRYYRYEYDETYKIVAPKAYPKKAVAVFFAPGSNPKGQVVFEDRTTEVRVCYSDKKSNELILTNTNQLSEDRVTDFPIKFISSKDPIIRSRYSILVKQYVQNLAAHTFYETLKEIADIGSILSQTQPGFFYGNINPVDNPGEKVIGFFNVSSYSEKRIFFNFTDLFPKEPIPKYQYYCPSPIPENEINDFYFEYCFNPNNEICRGNDILDLLKSGIKTFFPNESPTSYLLYPVECGDCTSFSSNIKPSFWID